MEIKQQEQDGIVIITPVGRIDTVTASDFEFKLTMHVDDNKTKLLVDFSQVELISSAGLRVLLMIGKKLKPRNGELAMCAMSVNVREVFDISGFATMFSIYDDVNAAVDALK